MSLFKEIGKWVHGWHLEYLWQHTPNGDITVQKGAAQGAIAIGNLLTLLDSPEGEALKGYISNEGQDTIQKVEDLLERVEGDLMVVQTLPDTATKLKDYQFSTDERENTFVHNIVDTAALALNDGKVSILEGFTFLSIILAYIKGN